MEQRAPLNFLESTQHDPLFAAEGMDLERGEATIDAIETIAQEFEEVSGMTSLLRRLLFARYPVAKYAIPVPFLRSFIESERARRRFLANPSMSAGENLISAWKKTQGDLSRSIERFFALHRLVYRIDQRHGGTHSIHDMHGNLIELKDVHNLLSLMQKNVRALEEEIAERSKMLHALNTGPFKEHTHKSDFAAAFEPGVIPEKYVRLHELEITYGLPFRHGEIVERHGSLTYTLSQFDGKPTPYTFMLYIVRDTGSGMHTMKILPIEKYLFLRVYGKDNIKFPPVGRLVYESMIRRKIPYWHQCATNLYTMRDQQYWADVATIVDLKRRPHLDAALVRSQRSSMFDLLLAACLEDHQIFMSHARERIHERGYFPHPLLYWLLMRTHSSIYYLPFNGSVWRLSEKPNFLGSGREQPEDILYESADSMLEQVSPEEIERIMQGGLIREEDRRAAQASGF